MRGREGRVKGRWGLKVVGGGKGHLELFRKLISFGVAIRPSYLDLGLTSQLHPGSCPFFTATSSHLSKIKVKLDKLAEDQIKII